MALLTSTPSCESCAGLSQKLSELEHRITLLFRLHDERDSVIILGKNRATATSAQLADTARLSIETSGPQAKETFPAQRSLSPPNTSSHNLDHYWLKRGAKPKGPRSSTPRRDEPWTRAGGRCARDRRSTGELVLTNRFNLLDPDIFPPLPTRHHSLQPVSAQSGTPNHHPTMITGCPPSARTRRGKLHFTPAPKHGAQRLSASPPEKHQQPRECAAPTPPAGERRGRPAPSTLRTSCPPARGGHGEARAAPSERVRTRTAATARSGPSVLVLGSSMVRHVRVRSGHTSCHPGALTLDIRDSAPDIIHNHPSASTVVIHVGTNDLKLQQSEKLKLDFISLITTIKNCNKNCIVSGPLPAPRFGDIKFSRLRLLHLFLKNYCTENKIPYVDNFLTFFNRPGLFMKDRLHPNIPGSRLLSLNIQLAIDSS